MKYKVGDTVNLIKLPFDDKGGIYVKLGLNKIVYVTPDMIAIETKDKKSYWFCDIDCFQPPIKKSHLPAWMKG